MVSSRVRAVHRISWWLLRHDFRGAGRIRGAAADLLAPAPMGPAVLRTMQGFLIEADASTDTGVERSLYRFGTYEAGTLQAMSACLRAGDTFVDVGANIGLMALHAAGCVGPGGRVLALEPEPGIASRLARNLALNPERHVEVRPVALGSAPGRATISRPAGGNRGGATLQPLAEPAGTVEVAVETLDRVLAAEGIARVRMLKVDIQGGELPALHGARSLLSGSNAPILCIEHDPRELPSGQAPSAVLELVCAANAYQAFRLARGKEIPSPLARVRSPEDLPRVAGDNLFYLLRAHIDELRGGGLIGPG